ncbi:DM13 domain-containing protein [Joostella atrarenae]|uniref:DM13 domain-containing protein n=2 Tax=Joostella atrarenae TaxID=679257 RepID=A0ABS9J6P1_9FLAO|nr:DM13 domain-containing protein [Joostella atrarenae]
MYLLIIIGALLLGVAIYALSPILYDNKVNDPVISSQEITENNNITIIASGEFKDADERHKGSGIAEIIKREDGFYLQLKDFNATNGPNLKLWLSTYKEPTNKNATDENSYLDLGNLKGNVGNQSYKLPDDFQINDYHSVTVYCKLFRVLFTTATLKHTKK